MNNAIISALDAVPAADLAYHEWLAVGMALEHEGFPCSVWDTWSQNDSRYKEGECQRKWRGFRDKSRIVTGGTIIQMARRYGWTFATNGGCIGWNDAIEYDGAAPVGSQESSKNPTGELITYLHALYGPNDHVAYCLDAKHDEEKDKWYPCSNGEYSRTRDEIILALERNPGDIAAALGAVNKAAGAWIRINPVDGQGAADKNVTRFGYALVESDNMPLGEQLQKMYDLRLPIKMVVYSGGKSFHAIVRVDALNDDEYRANVAYLFNYCNAHGLQVDRNNSNPSRLSRMPGVERGENYQHIVATDIGYRSWDEWKYYAENGDDDLPEFEVLTAEDIENPPELPEELIAGILRCGHKMLLSGASKCGKSFLLMQLCIAIAEGRKWLGFQCKQGRVLYINLEIGPNSAINRFSEIYKALGIQYNASNNLVIWNLRGKALPLDKLAPRLIHKMQNQEYLAVVFDPIYKIITGDENNASEMGQFCNQFDKVCKETGAAAIYCHHHSKGAQGSKRAMDRASGSGVFARDPDAQLDIIELVLTDEVKNNLRDKKTDTAWRMESSLREFPNITPVNFWYSCPIHRVDDTGELAKLPAEGSPEANRAKSGKRQKGEDWRGKLDAAYNLLFPMNEACEGSPLVKLKELATYYDVSDRTVREWIKKSDGVYRCEKGLVWRVEQKEGK